MEFLAFFIVCGIIVLIGAFVLGVITIIDKINEYKTKKVKEKYPELSAEMGARYDDMLKWSKYWNENVRPIRDEIEQTINDIYMQDDERAEKLYNARKGVAELMKTYDEHIEVNRKWREEIQQKVDEIYITDKKISLLWTPTCKRGK